MLNVESHLLRVTSQYILPPWPPLFSFSFLISFYERITARLGCGFMHDSRLLSGKVISNESQNDWIDNYYHLVKKFLLVLNPTTNNNIVRWLFLCDGFHVKKYDVNYCSQEKLKMIRNPIKINIYIYIYI